MARQEGIQYGKRNQNGASNRSKKQNSKPNKLGPASPRASFEQYTKLANDAATAGDLVKSEEYHQRADHYFRLINKMPSRNV